MNTKAYINEAGEVSPESWLMAKALSWTLSHLRRPTISGSFIAGHQSRDAEVAALKAKIQEIEKANQALREYIHAHS